MRTIHIYIECIKVTTDYWDIRPSVTTDFISGTTKQILIIKLVLESIYQIIFNNILYII